MFILLFCFSSEIVAAAEKEKQVLFVYTYANSAWGHVFKAKVIDSEGNLLEYDPKYKENKNSFYDILNAGDFSEFKTIKKISNEQFENMKKLSTSPEIPKIDSYSKSGICCRDAGTFKIEVYSKNIGARYLNWFLLIQWGNSCQRNLSEDGIELTKILLKEFTDTNDFTKVGCWCCD